MNQTEKLSVLRTIIIKVNDLIQFKKSFIQLMKKSFVFEKVPLPYQEHLIKTMRLVTVMWNEVTPLMQKFSSHGSPDSTPEADVEMKKFAQVMDDMDSVDKEEKIVMQLFNARHKCGFSLN